MTGYGWPGFALDVAFDGPGVVMFVRGEVDLLTASTMAAVLDALVGQGHQHVTVDLSELAFMDAAGLEVLVDTAERLTGVAGALVVRSAPALTTRIIQIAGVDDRMTQVPPAGPAPPAGSDPRADGPGRRGHGDPPPGRQDADVHRHGLQADLARVRSRRADTRVIDAALRLIAFLTLAAVEGADGVSVTLPRQGHLTTVASTNQTIRRMDDHQYETGQGPCLSAAEEARSFYAASLTDETRWPEFIPRGRQEGIGSILSTPLMDAAGPLGALNIYSRTDAAFGPQQQEVASLFAHHAAGLVADRRGEAAEEQLATRIEDALLAREIIAQAQGIHMARAGMSPIDAAAALHRDARAREVTVASAAAAVVRTTQDTSNPPVPGGDHG